MSRLETDDIWVLRPSREDCYLGARYAGISLAWTYDRMDQEGKDTNGTRNRAFNISKGLVGQRLLGRELASRDVDVEIEEKSHRETDAYDLRFPDQRDFSDLDIKTFNHFNNYGVDQKSELDAELIASNSQYEGPEWGQFFPLLIPYDQFSQHKDAYCFGISSSIDFRDTIEGRIGYELYAFPDLDSELGEFLVSDVERREASDSTFSVDIAITSDDESESADIKVIGELGGDIEEKWVTVDGTETQIGPFTGINSFKIREDEYRRLKRESSVFTISLSPDGVFDDQTIRLSSDDFHNLLMPSDFTFYFLGWITKEEFKQRAITHPGWIGPDEQTFTENQKWEYLTDEDEQLLSHNDLRWTIEAESDVCGALRKNAGCYYYPKLTPQKPRVGGLRKTNLYVLPGDLRPMETL